MCTEWLWKKPLIVTKSTLLALGTKSFWLELDKNSPIYNVKHITELHLPAYLYVHLFTLLLDNLDFSVWLITIDTRKKPPIDDLYRANNNW